MALPQTVKGPSNTSKIGDKSFKIRPFSGKEEKAVFMAKLQNDKDAFLETVIDVVSSCSDTDASELTQAEFEKLFLDIRCISVSDTFEPNLSCKKCGTQHAVKIPASKLVMPEKFSFTTDIKVGQNSNGHDIFIKLKTPTLRKVIDAAKYEDSDIRTIYSSVDSIYDQEVYDDFTYEEFKEWFTSLSGVYLLALAFVKESPEITYSNKFKCAECKDQNDFELRGLKSFLS